MSVGKTEVYATVDGIIKHRHDGVKGWHSAHIKHADPAFHATAAQADVSGLSPELQARHVEALAGKSFEYLWAPRSRHAEVRTRSPRAEAKPVYSYDEYGELVIPHEPTEAELFARAVQEAEAEVKEVLAAKVPAKK